MKCKICDVVMTQCRCPSKDKAVEWKVCKNCQDKNMAEARIINAAKLLDSAPVDTKNRILRISATSQKEAVLKLKSLSGEENA